MAGRMNWTRAYYDRKIREQGYVPADEPGPRTPEQKGGKPKGSQAAKSGSNKWKEKNRGLQERREAARVNYIKAVSRSLARGKPLPPPFKKMHPDVKKEVSAVGPETWVLKQPEFADQIFGCENGSKTTSASEKLKTKTALQNEIRELSSQMETLAQQYHALGGQVMRLRERLKTLG